ncbi:MAG TPA: ECF-type sigma factor [Candidatus Paceibacterota bacterium]|nr:ECF-type sigma factor [Verrucomicrobiota bacterium]HRZ45513.1 ECF-type sigma factor [Candidatus Paceibacterota bacterium]HRZ93795.1 ECF-type sigma factor [Candidatus Paceibacterota bacterium]
MPLERGGSQPQHPCTRNESRNHRLQLHHGVHRRRFSAHFVGMSMPEAAEVLGVSLRSAERLWTFARAWLRHEIGS